MTWLDWVVVALFVYFIVQGLLKGATAALLGTVAVVLAYVLAAVLLPRVGAAFVDSALMPQALTPEWRRMIAFTLTFALLYLVFMLVISILPGAKQPMMLVQILGLAAGAIKALAVSMALAGILLASPSPGLRQDVERSALVRYVAVLQRQYIQDIRRVSPVPFPPVGPDSKF
jgi:uncharacterized membrane protein required for colicin V production